MYARSIYADVMLPRLVVISYHPPSLLFTGCLSTGNWTLSLTNHLLHVPSLNWTADKFHSGTRLTLLITFRFEPHRKHLSSFYSPTIPRPLHRNWRFFIRLLHSNSCYLQSHRLSMSLYPTIWWTLNKWDVLLWMGFFSPLDYIWTPPVSRLYSIGFDDEYFEGSGRDLFQILPRYLPRRIEETH
jgi:hypothetical protein